MLRNPYTLVLSLSPLYFHLCCRTESTYTIRPDDYIYFNNKDCSTNTIGINACSLVDLEFPRPFSERVREKHGQGENSIALNSIQSHEKRNYTNRLNMKKTTKQLLCLFLPLLIFSCTKEDHTNRVHGVVYNLNSTDPVPGAIVYIAGKQDFIYSVVDSVRADENGQFILSDDNHLFNRYKIQAFSPNHAPWDDKNVPIDWNYDFGAPFKGRMDIHLVPRSWLRIRAVKVSNAQALFINPIWDRFPVATTADEITFLWAAPGNQELVLPCFREYTDSTVGFRNPIIYYAPAFDTIDVLVEW